MATRLNLPAKDIRRGLEISVVEGTFATIHAQLTGGIFLSGIALFLGATDFEIGVMGVLPALLLRLGSLRPFWFLQCFYYLDGR